MIGVNEQLTALIKPVVTGLGYELWGLEYLTQGRYSVLKIFIDAKQGINADDCARISKQVGGLLDVEDPIKSKYTLEVSSPGVDRRLFTIAQVDLYKGAEIKVGLHAPYEGKRKYKGINHGIEDGDVVLRIGDEEYLFPFEDIDRACVIPSFSDKL